MNQSIRIHIRIRRHIVPHICSRAAFQCHGTKAWKREGKEKMRAGPTIIENDPFPVRLPRPFRLSKARTYLNSEVGKREKARLRRRRKVSNLGTHDRRVLISSSVFEIIITAIKTSGRRKETNGLFQSSLQSMAIHECDDRAEGKVRFDLGIEGLKGTIRYPLDLPMLWRTTFPIHYNVVFPVRLLSSVRSEGVFESN